MKELTLLQKTLPREAGWHDQKGDYCETFTDVDNARRQACLTTFRLFPRTVNTCAHVLAEILFNYHKYTLSWSPLEVAESESCEDFLSVSDQA